jgi:hypothetical protein
MSVCKRYRLLLMGFDSIQLNLDYFLLWTDKFYKFRIQGLLECVLAIINFFVGNETENPILLQIFSCKCKLVLIEVNIIL